MSEMVERVARAMSECEPNDTTRRIARLAIEAMREPTDAMVEATLHPNTNRDSSVEEIYQVMIDEAMK